MSDDLFGMLGDEEGEDNNSRKRKTRGKHNKDEDDDNEFEFFGTFLKKITKNKWLLAGVIVGALILIAVLISLLIFFWPYLAKFAQNIKLADIIKSFLG